MSTYGDIDTIIEELLLIDPTLASYAEDLRATLTALIREKPVVVIDSVFKETLRKRLVVASQKSVPSPYAQLSWWSLRLAPVGAFALLLLILAPAGLLRAPTSPVAVTESDTLNTEMTDFAAGDAPTPTESRIGLYDTGMGGESSEPSMMSMKAMTEEAPEPAPLTVSPQLPGNSVRIDTVTVLRPSFVVIYMVDISGHERIVGVSPILNAGTTERVPVYLRNSTQPGQTYAAGIHTDNGNGVFTLNEDIPLPDTTGIPFRVFFDIVTSE